MKLPVDSIVFNIRKACTSHHLRNHPFYRFKSKMQVNNISINSNNDDEHVDENNLIIVSNAISVFFLSFFFQFPFDFISQTHTHTRKAGRQLKKPENDPSQVKAGSKFDYFCNFPVKRAIYQPTHTHTHTHTERLPAQPISV